MKNSNHIAIDINKPYKPKVPEMGGVGLVFSVTVSLTLVGGALILFNIYEEPSYIYAALAVVFIASYIGLFDDISIISKYSKKLQDINIKCVGFCDKSAIEFDPDILGPKLLSFIDLENKKRRSEGLDNLQTIPTTTLKIRKNLYDELDKAIN